jgi:hypothetical protein
MLRSIDWSLITDVSGHHIGPILKGQAVQEYGTDILYRNVGNQRPIYAA